MDMKTNAQQEELVYDIFNLHTDKFFSCGYSWRPLELNFLMALWLIKYAYIADKIKNFIDCRF